MRWYDGFVVALANPGFLIGSLGYSIGVPGDWEGSNLNWLVDENGGWKTAVVYLYIMGWSAYGVETCAAFAPEYKDTVRDTTLALRSAAMFSLFVYILLPLGVAGTVGQATIAEDASGIVYP